VADERGERRSVSKKSRRNSSRSQAFAVVLRCSTSVASACESVYGRLFENSSGTPPEEGASMMRRISSAFLRWIRDTDAVVEAQT